jgi:4-amino-4-deoxy-L-arabinose transferase-like glycosyltransferase
MGVALFLWCLLLRLPTLQRSVIDWDESLYMLMAEQWMDGHLPYTTVWDHKPVGVYVIVRFAMTLVGQSILASRLASILFVFLAAQMIRRITARLVPSEGGGLVAGFAYPAFSLLLGGAASNTEHYLIALVLSGGFILLRSYQLAPNEKSRLLHLCAAGLLFGLALQVKYLILPQVVLLSAVYFFVERKRTPLPKLASLAALEGTLILLPTLAVVGYFAAHGEYRTFIEANFTANTRHVANREWYRLPKSLLEWFRCSASLWLVGMLGWASPAANASERTRRWRLLALIGAWFGVALAECFASFKFYEYYFLTTIPPACIALGLATHFLKIADRSRVLALSCGILIALIPLAEAVKTLYRPWARERGAYGVDPQIHIASVLRSRLEPNDLIFVLSGEPILYSLLNSRLPTKFVLPPFLLDPHFNRVANVDYRDEFRRILALRPRCIVNRDDGNPRIEEFKRLLGREYVPTTVTPDTEIICRAVAP